MEKILDLNNNEHWLLLERLLSKINDSQINLILDAGSGKTSLSSLLSFFNNGFVEAIIFPGDDRKRNSIEGNIISDRYKLIEKDICKETIIETYDLVLAHLLLGEAVKWGNKVEILLEKLVDINSKYFIIVDVLEDKEINYDYLEQHLINNNLKIIAKESINKKDPQNLGDFAARKYVGYLVEKNK